MLHRRSTFSDMLATAWSSRFVSSSCGEGEGRDAVDDVTSVDSTGDVVERDVIGDDVIGDSMNDGA